MLDQLNPQQKKAVTHDSGPLLILAGAGSGKTRALTYRAAYLMKEKGVSPERILLTTFTNKAAGEMQERLFQLTGVRLPFAGTFHSLSSRLLRKHGYEIGIDQNFVIYDSRDQIDAIKQAMKDLKIDPKEVKPGAAFGMIDNAKNELIGSREYAGFARGPFQEKVAAIYKQYQKILQKSNALDFSDLLFIVVKLLKKSDNIRTRYQEQFLHVLVDEYQDTNKAQYELTKIFAAGHNNVCVVGDASQAIYSWRGADYRNLQLLQQDFAKIVTIRLEQNYRSTQNILDAAYGVITNNKLHPILSLWTDQDDGESVQIFEAEDEYSEIRYIINHLKVQPRLELNNSAILYRTNAQSRIVEEMLMRYSIPYTLIGGVKFYERKEVKDVLAYLRLAYNQNDLISQQRVIKLGKRRFADFQNWLENADLSRPPLEILDDIIKATDYLGRYDKKKEEDLSRIENVQELRSVAQEFADLTDFLENVALVEQNPQTNSDSDQEEGVVLMTLHASKGLEFDHVYMIGMEEGLFPHSRTLMSTHELEEERRLCYVGITRAQKTLHLTHANKRLYFGSRSQNPGSRFLSEIPDHVKNTQTNAASITRKPSPIDDELLDAFLDDKIDIDEFLSS